MEDVLTTMAPSVMRTPYPFYEYWIKQAKWDSRARAALPLAMGVVSKVG